MTSARPRSTIGTRSLYWRLLRQARPYWPHLVGIFLLQTLSAPLALMKPLGLKIAVDSVIGSAPLPRFLQPFVPATLLHRGAGLLVLAVGLQVAVVLLIQCQELAHHVFSSYVGQSLTVGFRARLFDHLQRLSLAFHDTRGSGDSLYRMQHDAPSIQWVMVYGVLPVASSILMLVSMIYVTARINWHLALVAIAISPVLAVFAGAYDRRMSGRYRRASEIDSSALEVVQQALTAIRVVKAFGREDRENERFVGFSRQGLRAYSWLAVSEGAFGLLVNLTIAVGTSAVLFVGVRNVQAGVLSVGDLLMVLGYLAELYGPLETISNQVAGLQSSLASARRVFEVLDEAPEVVERPHARTVTRAVGAIEFRNVSFGYEPTRLVLHDLSISVLAGASIGVQGRTGAGKTTLVSLLTRFYDPTSGRILLDGIDVRDYRLADLRNQFGLVLQESVLFPATIAENIAYGRPDATDAQIVEAARAAEAHDFIERLPQRYQTWVGERGMTLSGGERQRIALARAFLKDAPVLILDEPTSAVDRETEAAIMTAIGRLMRGRTTFLISHRSGALEHCDILLSLEDGRLTEVTAGAA